MKNTNKTKTVSKKIIITEAQASTLISNIEIKNEEKSKSKQ